MLRALGKLLPVIVMALLSARAFAGDFLAVASTDKTYRPRGAHLTLGTALQTAEAEALRNHVSLSDFQSPWFRYDYELYHYDNGDGYYVWAFIYEAKAPSAASHFVVIVNDHTRRAEFVPGG